MGCPGNQRIAGGGVLLPQGLNFTYSKGFEPLLKLLLPFQNGSKSFFMRDLAYR